MLQVYIVLISLTCQLPLLFLILPTVYSRSALPCWYIPWSCPIWWLSDSRSCTNLHTVPLHNAHSPFHFHSGEQDWNNGLLHPPVPTYPTSFLPYSLTMVQWLLSHWEMEPMFPFATSTSGTDECFSAMGDSEGPETRSGGCFRTIMHTSEAEMNVLNPWARAGVPFWAHYCHRPKTHSLKHIQPFLQCCGHSVFQSAHGNHNTLHLEISFPVLNFLLKPVSGRQSSWESRRWLPSKTSAKVCVMCSHICYLGCRRDFHKGVFCGRDFYLFIFFFAVSDLVNGAVVDLNRESSTEVSAVCLCDLCVWLPWLSMWIMVWTLSTFSH